MNAAQQQNPFAYWQETMSHWMPSSTLCNPTQAKASADPFSFGYNPQQMMQLWQQGMQMWLAMMMPQQQASNPMMDMMTQWQQMCQQTWMKGMSGR